MGSAYTKRRSPLNRVPGVPCGSTAPTVISPIESEALVTGVMERAISFESIRPRENALSKIVGTNAPFEVVPVPNEYTARRGRRETNLR